MHQSSLIHCALYGMVAETSQELHGKSELTSSGMKHYLFSQGQNQSGRQVGFGASRPGAGQTHHQKPVPKQQQESQPPKSNSSSFETLVVTEASSINAEEAEETEVFVILEMMR